MSFYKYQDTVNNNGNSDITIPGTSGSISDTYQRVHEHSVIVRNPGLVNMNHLNSNVNDTGQGTKCRDIKYVIKENERGWKNCQEKQESSLSVHPVQIVSQHIDGSINVLESSENLPSPNLTQIVHDNSDYLNRNVLKPNSQRADLSVEEAQKQSHCYGDDQLSEKPFTESTRVTKPCKIGPHRSRSDSFVHLHNRDDRDNFDHCSFLPVKSFQNNGNEQSQYNQFNLNATGMFTESNNNLSFGAAGDTDKNQDCYGTRYSSPMSVSSQVLHSWLDGSDSNDGSRLLICESESDDSVDNLQDENNAYLKNKNRHGYLGKEETEDKDTTESDLLNEKNIGYSNDSAEKLNGVPENKSENCMNNSIYLDAICDEEDGCQENSMYVSCLDDNKEDSDGNYTDTTQIYVDFNFKDQPHPLKLKVDKLKDDIKNYKLQCATPSRKSSSNFKIEPQDFKNSTFKLFFKECIDGLLNDDEGIYDLTSGKKLFELKDWIEKLITCNSSDKNIQIVDLIHLLSSCVVLAHTALKNLSFLHFPSTVLVKDGHDSSSHFEALLKNRLQIFVTDGLMMSDLAFSLYEQVQKEELDKKITCDNKLSEKKDINADTSTAISKDMNPDIHASGTLSDPKVLSSESSYKNISDIDSKEISSQEISEPEVLSFTNVSAVSSTETISDIKDCKVLSNEKITSDFTVISSETVSDTIDSKMPLSETMSDTVDLKVPSSETMPGTIESKVLYSATLANAIDSKSQTNPDTIYFNVIYPQTVSNIIDSNVHLSETTNDSFESKVICSDAVPSNMYFPETKLDNVDSKVSFTKSISDIVYIKVLPSETITGAIDSNELSSVVLPDKIESNVCFEDTTSKVMDPIVSSSETLPDRIDSTVVSSKATIDAAIFNVTSTGTFLDPGIIKSKEPVTEAVEMLQAVKETEDLYNMAKTTSQIRSAYQPTVTKPVRRKLKLINEYRYSPVPCPDEVAVNTADDEYEKPLIQHAASNAGESGQVPDNILKSFYPVNQDGNMLEENKVPLNNYGLLVVPINGGSMKEITNGSLITENIGPICDTEIKSEADLEVSRRSSQNCQQNLKDSRDRGHTTNKNREHVSQQADCSSLQNRNDPVVKQNRKHETGMTVKYSDDVVLKRKISEDVSPTRVCNELNINETKNTSEVQKHIQHSGQESAKECQSLQKDSVKSIQELPRKCVEEKYDQGKSETKYNDTPPTSPFKSLSDPEKARAMFKNLKLICSPVLTSLVNSRGDKSTQVSEKVINCYHTQNKIESRAADSNGKNQNRKDMCRENICKDKQRQSEKMCKDKQKQSENICKEKQRQSENICIDKQRQSENMCKETQRQSENMCKETQRQSEIMCKDKQRQSENMCKETQRQSENMCKETQRQSENMCKDKQRQSENKRSNVCDDDRVKKTSQFKHHTKENHTKNKVSSQTNNGQNANAEILFTPDKNTSKIKICKNVSHGEKRKGFHGHETHVAHIENGSPCKIRKTSSHVKEAADNVSFQSSPCKIRKFEGTSMHQNVNKTSKYHNTCGSSANDRHVNSFTTNIPDRDSTKKASTSKHSRPVLSSEKSDNKTKIKIKQANRISEVYDQSSVTNSKGQNSIKEKQPTTTNDSCHNKDYRITKEETSTTGHSHRDDSVSREIPSKRQTGQNGIKVVATTETSSRKQSHRKDDQKVTTETTIKGHSHRKDDKIVTIEGSSKGHSHRKNSQNVSANASKHTRPNDHGQRFTPNKSINDQIHKKDLQLEIASKTQKSDKDMRKNISSQSCSNQNDGQNVSTKPSSHRKDYHNSSEDTTLERKVYRSEKKSRERKSDHDKVKHLERTFEIVTSTNSGRSVALQVSINESSASFSNVSVSGVVDSSRHSCNTSTVQHHTGVKSKSSDSGKTTSSGQTNDKRHIGNNCKNTEHSNVKTCNNNRLYSSNKDGCHGNRIRKSSSERSSKRKHKTFESSDRGTVSRKTAVKDYSNKRNELQHTTYTIADDGIETNFDQSVIGFTLKTERQLAVHVSSSKSKLTPGSSRYVADYRDKDEDIQNGKLENKENHRNGRNTEHTKNSSYGIKESGHTKRLEKDLNVSAEPSIKVRSSSSVLEEVTCDNYTVETSSSSEALNIVSKQRNDISFSSISDSSSEDEEQIKPFYGSGFSLLHSLSHTLLDEEADLPSLILPNKRRNMKNHHGNLRRCHRSDLNSQNNIQKILAREYSQQSDDIVSPSDVASSSNTSEISNLINRSPDRESVSPLSRRHRHRRKYLLDYACTSSSSEEIIPECRQRGLQSKKECFMILDRIYNYRLAEPFRHEVRSQDVPGYYLVIKRGMCLDMMAHKLRDNIYEKEEDFVTDMRLIFNNCRLFHQRGSPIYEAGQAVERYFDQMMKEVFPDLNRYEFL